MAFVQFFEVWYKFYKTTLKHLLSTPIKILELVERSDRKLNHKIEIEGAKVFKNKVKW